MDRPTNAYSTHKRTTLPTGFRDNVRPEVVSDVISGVAVDYFGMDVSVKFGDYTSKCARDIQAAQFLMDERTTNDRRQPTDPVHANRNQFSYED